jgi:hypothetical protein
MIKRHLVKLQLVSVVVVSLMALGAWQASAASAKDSTFAFCNTTGGTIACFHAVLSYTDSKHFTLGDITLSDTLKDNRAVQALVFSQAESWITGLYGPGFSQPYTFFNGKGAGSVINFGTFAFSSQFGDNIDWLQIRLIACNSTSCSTAAYSFRHGNPYTGH